MLPSTCRLIGVVNTQITSFFCCGALKPKNWGSQYQWLGTLLKKKNLGVDLSQGRIGEAHCEL